MTPATGGGPHARLHDIRVEGDPGADGDLGGPAFAEAVQRALAEAMVGEHALRAAIADQVASQVADQIAHEVVSRVTP